MFLEALGPAPCQQMLSSTLTFLYLSYKVLARMGLAESGNRYVCFFFIAQSLNICYVNNNWVSTENGVLYVQHSFFLPVHQDLARKWFNE